MLEELNVMLEEWADWSIRRLDEGLGWPKESTLGRIQRLGPTGAAIRGDFGPRTVEITATVEKVDRAIAGLPERHREVLKVHYLTRLTDKQKAKEVKLSYAVYRRYVHLAKCILYGCLCLGRNVGLRA